MYLQLDAEQLDKIESALAYRASEIRKASLEVKGTNAEGPKARLIAKADGYQAVLDTIRNKRVIGENDDAYRAAASERWHEEGACEIDEGALVSIGDDPGAYVMAWVWVDDEDAGISKEEGDDAE